MFYTLSRQSAWLDIHDCHICAISSLLRRGEGSKVGRQKANIKYRPILILNCICASSQSPNICSPRCRDTRTHPQRFFLVSSLHLPPPSPVKGQSSAARTVAHTHQQLSSSFWHKQQTEQHLFFLLPMFALFFYLTSFLSSTNLSPLMPKKSITVTYSLSLSHSPRLLTVVVVSHDGGTRKSLT
jgi:hypothetical protein